MGSALAIAMIEGVASIMTSPATCFPLSNDLVLDKLDIAEDQRGAPVFSPHFVHIRLIQLVAILLRRSRQDRRSYLDWSASNKSAQPSSLNQAHPNRASIFALGFL
jgi:hypothetical protein